MRASYGSKVEYSFKRALSVIVAVSMIAMFLPSLQRTTAAAAGDSSFVFTDYIPTVSEVVDASGFKHPGVGLTKDILENLQTQIRAQKEPWTSYFNQMLLSAAAAKTIASSNESGTDPTKPGTDAFNSQGVESKFIADALKAYTQSILYVVTGDETYRANALHIIRIWSQMDPAKYAYYTDAHIHSGVPLNRMVTAAEILRYTSTENAELQWTEQDTSAFTDHLITPVIETLQHSNNYFMNQHLYPLLGAMAGYIFTGNRDRYDEAVEWFTVNESAVDQGQNGSIKQLFRWVDTNDLTGGPVDNPQVQLVEMGRDQAHGTGDVINVSILSRLMLAQGTAVDPVDGTVSAAADAVTPYDFLGKRILQGADYFARYMIGYDTPWIPTAAHTDAEGHPTIVYKQLAGGYRGRIGGNVYDLYYYYKYSEGLNMEQAAPYLTEMFRKRLPFYWESPDAGADYWLYIPQEAEAEGASDLPKAVSDPDLREIEDRYTRFDDNAETAQEGDTSYVELKATEEGTKIALVGSSTGEKALGFRIRTDGPAHLDLIGGINDTLTLPDTKGQWQYATYTLNNFQGLGELLYLVAKGDGTTVDIDHINVKAGSQLTPPAFVGGNAPAALYAYVGSDAAVRYSFAAADANAADTVTYQMDGLPEGAAMDGSSGAFSWSPTEPGTYRLVASASDGTAFAAKDVTIVVADDRESALAAASAAYDPGQSYVGATLEQYENAYEDALNAISTASDEQFYEKLNELSQAVAQLQELTPRLSDGSIDYRKMFVSSTFGNELPNLLDQSPDSFAGYYLAQNLTYYMDVGPGFRLTANAFGLQVRASFPERIGGVAVFGSNDRLNWTRMTPGLTTVTEDMQTLEVPDELRDEPFRFLKIQMVEPSSTMLEMSEFRIFGERHEVVNKLESVSIGSDQALNGRIVLGDTARLTFLATEAIQDVQVAIQGQPATLHSDDGLHWTAEAAMGPGAVPGNVQFRLTYKTAAGEAAAEVIFTTDDSSLVLADESDVIGDIASLTEISDSSGRTPTDARATAAALFDGDPGSITDYRVNGSGYGGYVTFDFREGGSAKLTSVELLARQDGYFGRIGGAVVQGSDDNATWITLTPAAAGISNWQTLAVTDPQSYRYIRIYNGNNWYGNMSEVRFHGTVKSPVRIGSVSISSDQAARGRIVAGDTVKLAFAAAEPIQGVAVRIQGQEAAVHSDDQLNWTAEAAIGDEAAPGPVTFSIDYQTEDGTKAPAIASTTDGSSLFIADETDLIRNVLDKVDLRDSSGRNPADLLATAGALFDGDPGTITDFRVNGKGSGGWIIFDFREGYRASLASAELLARQDGYYTRIKGAVVQGSNDGETWTTLTPAAGSTNDWQTLTATDSSPYRYLRVYNGNNWFGNMAELRLHGAVTALDTTAPVTTDDAPQGWTNADATVSFQATDDGSGVAATYYALDGADAVAGDSATLSEEGEHEIVYWSVDRAGNVEEPHTVAVRIDKRAPTLTAAPDREAIWPPNKKLVEIKADVAASDEDSGVATVVLESIVCDDPNGAAEDIEAAIGTDATSFKLRAVKSRTYTITYAAVDQAGNRTETSFTVTVPHDRSGQHGDDSGQQQDGSGQHGDG